MGLVRFGDLELDLDAMELRQGGREIPLQRRTLDLLRYLIENADRVVEKGELFQAVWSGSVVSESALTQAIKQARRAVGDDGAAQAVIQTLRGRGYRFVAPTVHVEKPTRPALDDPFVGRDALLAEALGDFETDAAGSVRTLLLTGEAGIGKTRTASEIAARLRDRGARVLSGRCPEVGAAPAYWPWIRALRGLDALDIPAAGAALVARAVPELIGLLPDVEAARPAADPSSDGERFLLFDALAGALIGEAARGPVVVFLDDLHLADLPSLHLLEFTLREVETAQIFFLLTSREAELRADSQRAHILGSIGRTRGVRIRALPGLTAAEVGRYLELRTGRKTPEAQVDELRRRSGGNPFFLTQLVATGAPFTADRALAASAREAIVLHLDALPEACRQLLAEASVLGQCFDVAVLAHMVGASPERLPALLAPAVAAGVLETRGSDLAGLQFCHGLVPEVLQEQLEVTTRMELHGRAGRAIEAIHAADESRLAELASHYARSGVAEDAARAVALYCRAAVRASAALAFEEAVAHYERALDASTLACVAPRERMELLLGLGEAHNGFASYGDAKAVLMRARDLARHLGDDVALARAALGHAAEGEALDPDDDRIALLEEALAAIGGTPSSLRIRLLARLSEALYFASARSRAQELSLEAVRLARESGSQADLVYALRRRHFSVFDADHLDERLVLVQQMIRESDKLGDRLERLAARGSLVDDLVEAGDAGRLFVEVEAYRHEAELLRQPLHQWWAAMHGAMVLHLRGRFEAAEAEIERGYAMGLETTGALAPIWYLCQLWGLRRDQGRVLELEKPIHEAALRHPDSPWRFGVAQIHLLNGRNDAARSVLESAIHDDFASVRRDVNWMIALVVMSDVAVELADPGLADPLYQALIPYARQHAVVGQATSYVGCVSRYLGRLAIVLGRFDTGVRHLEMALEREQRLESLPNVAEVQASYGELLLRLGHEETREEAGERLGEAERIAGRIGMPHVLRRVHALQEELGNVPRIGRRRDQR